MTATYEAATGPEVSAALAALASTGRVPSGFAYNPIWNPTVRRRVGATVANDLGAVLEAQAHTTDATPTAMLDLFGEKLILPNEATWGFQGILVARRTDAANESALYTVVGAIDRFANAASTAVVAAVTPAVVIEDSAAWAVAVTANTTDGALVVTVTGEAAKTIDWFLRCTLVQVGG
jgi:hypothetical protein